MKLVLEPRFLFDGSVGALTHPTAQTTDPNAASHDVVPTVDHAAPVADIAAPAPTVLLIVDPRVADWKTLVAGAKPGVEVVVLDPSSDGVTQVTTALQSAGNVQALEFLTNGASGQIALGSTTLDAATLSARAGEIGGWSASLAPNAEIVLWGCDAGAGAAGAALVTGLHDVTGASIGASSDPTGSAALGGNWTLEVAAGSLSDASAPFTASSLASFSGVLDAPTLAVQQGVVSIVDDNGAVINSATGISYTGGGSAAPTALFAAAKSGTVFAGGATVPSTLVAASDNLDIAGAQAGDTVRVVTAVANSGVPAAFDVIVNNALSVGLTAANVTNLTFTRGDGTVLTALDPLTGTKVTGATAVADFFGTGVLLTNGGSTATATLAGSGSTADIVYITYDVTLSSTTATAAKLTSNATIVGWSAADTIVYGNSTPTYLDPTTHFDVNLAHSAVSGLTDTVAVTTMSPSVSDTIVTGVDASDTSAVVPSNTYPTNAATMVPGETIGLEATITLPQGVNGSVVFNDTLPNGMTPVTSGGSYTVTLHNNNGTTADLTAKASWTGQALTVSLGNLTVAEATGGDKASTVVIDYHALVPQTQVKAIDTSGWVSATTGDFTLTDTYVAPTEGLSYTAQTVTSPATINYQIQTINFPSDTPSWTNTQTLNLFNSTIGTLDNVTFISHLTGSSVGTISNTGAKAITTTLTTDTSEFLDIPANAALSTLLNSYPLGSAMFLQSSASQGYSLAVGGSGAYSKSYDAVASTSILATDLALFQDSSGSAQGLVASASGSFSVSGGGGNAKAVLSSLAQEVVTVTYAYTLAATSKSSTVTVGGVANAVTVTNPLVKAAITETGGTLGNPVNAGDTVTYQVTLTNSSTTATAYDLGTTLGLSSGLTYVAGSLAQVSGATATLTGSAVAAEGATPASDAISGITLAPGASAVFTFKGKVDGGLAGGATLTASTAPDWTSLPASATIDGAGNVNPQAQAYINAQVTVSNSFAAASVTPDLSIIGESNNTAGNGTSFDPTGQTVPASVLTTDGEIVRMRATLQLPEGTQTGVSMALGLPAGLSFANDGSARVLLVSPNGDFTTSLTGTGLQAAEGATPIDTTKLGLGLGASDPVTAVLAAGAITGSGSNITFNLGTLKHTDASAVPDYVIVEFNAVVGNTVADKSSLTTTMTGSANGSSVATVSDYINVQAPVVSIAKSITGVVNNPDGTVTVTYVDVVSNTGTGPAYGASVVDHGAGTGTASYGGTTSGTGTGVSGSTSGGDFDATITKLPGSGGSQSFTYTVTLPANKVSGGITDAASVAKVTDTALNPALFTGVNEVLLNTSLVPATYTATATAGLDAISGTVNQDLGLTKGSGTPLQPLSGQTVTVTAPGLSGSETVTTDSSGNFVVLVPDNAGPVTLKVAPSGSNVPAGDVLDNTPATTASLVGTTPSTSGTNPVTLSFTPTASTNYGGINFNFWTGQDTAPVLSGAPGGPLTATGVPVTLFAAGTVADTQLDTNFAHDFSGTTLTLQRYVGGVATPNANDRFTGTGTASSGVFLDSGSGNVKLNGAVVGTFTNTGGVLSISFAATGVTATVADTVFQGIGYTNAGGATASTSVVIGAQIDDANSDPIGLNGFLPKVGGPHDQGPGGNLLSNVLTATLTLPSVTPDLSIIGESNNTAGNGTSFDPTGKTVPTTVLTTDGEITRMRATLQLPEGTNSSVSMALVLPAGLSFANDGSARVLLVSPNGDFTTSLTGTGLQFAEGGTPIDTSKLGLGIGVSDPVVAALSAGAITGSGSNITLNLGNLTNNDGSAVPNYVIVEFNATVGNAVADKSSLTTTMTGSANAVTVPTVSDYITVQAPVVSIAKTVSGIVNNPDGTVTITYVDVVTNSGTGPAYGASVVDHGAGVGTASYGGVTSGTGTGVSGSTSGGDFDATITKLPGGGSQSFTYTVTIPSSQLKNGVPPTSSVATVTDTALNPALFTGGKEVLLTTSLTPATGTDSASIGLDAISGTVNQDLGLIQGSGTPLQPLSGQSVTVTSPGLTGSQTVTTDSSGNFVVLVPGNAGPVTLTVTPGGSNVPAGDVLDNAPAATPSLADTKASTTGINPVTLSFSPAPATNYAGINFNFWVAPTIPPYHPPAPPFDPGGPPEPYGNNAWMWHNPDFLSRPLIPDLSLVGSVANRFIIVEQHAVIGIPPNIFQDTMDDPKLVYEAKRPDGSPLPSWLAFDPSSLTFTGTPPANSYGRVEILIHATDIAGRTADAVFNLLIGRKQEDMMRLLNGQRGKARLADLLADAGPAADALPEAALAVLQAPPPSALGGGLTAALRDFGPSGALGRARSLLDQLDALERNRAAA